MQFSFLHPQYLFFLLLVPLFIFIHFLSLSSRKKKALGFANFDAIAKIKGVDFFSKNIILLVINLLIITSVVFSLSGLTFHTEMKSSSFSYVLAIDSSQSMEASDFPPTRIDVAKNTAKNFIDFAPPDVRIGVVSFSGATKIESEMTENKDDLRRAVKGIQTTNLGGTDINEVVLTSANLLREEIQKSLVILSDGQMNVGNIDEAIYYANKNNVVIHTIAMGTLTGGETSVGFSKLDEDTLKSLAYSTGGNYTDVVNEAKLQDAFSDIFKYTKRKVSIEFADYLLIFAVFLIILEFFLSNTRYVNLP